jgi:hypothetical protein
MHPVRSQDTRLRSFLLRGETPAPEDETDGAALVSAAVEHGLAALLHEQVVRQGARWPVAALAALRDAHRWSLARGVRQIDGARHVLALLETHGLRALPLKGAALAESLYDSVAERPMADVDVLALDDFAGSRGVLLAAGFRAGDADDHACCLIEPDTGVVVELHRSVTSCGSLFPLDAERVWTRSRPGTGLLRRVPSPEDLLVQLSLHAAFQHGLCLRLVQFLDFRRVFERSPPRTNVLLEEAHAARALPSLALALKAATAMVGATIPGELSEALARALPQRLTAWLARRIANAETLPTPADADLLRLRWWLAGDKRYTLLRTALGGQDGPLWRRMERTVRRAVSLAWRWGPHPRPL